MNAGVVVAMSCRRGEVKSGVFCKVACDTECSITAANNETYYQNLEHFITFLQANVRSKRVAILYMLE